jgi:hypothetical protein
MLSGQLRHRLLLPQQLTDHLGFEGRREAGLSGDLFRGERFAEVVLQVGEHAPHRGRRDGLRQQMVARSLHRDVPRHRDKDALQLPLHDQRVAEGLHAGLVRDATERRRGLCHRTAVKLRAMPAQLAKEETL